MRGSATKSSTTLGMRVAHGRWGERRCGYLPTVRLGMPKGSGNMARCVNGLPPRREAMEGARDLGPCSPQPGAAGPLGSGFFLPKWPLWRFLRAVRAERADLLLWVDTYIYKNKNWSRNALRGVYICPTMATTAILVTRSKKVGGGSRKPHNRKSARSARSARSLARKAKSTAG